LAVVGSHGGIIGEILLQEPGRQFSGKGAGTTFPLREGDRGWTGAAVEIEIEGSCRLLEPLLSELVAGGSDIAWMFVHGCLPRDKETR
jgi:hypothetical protein